MRRQLRFAATLLATLASVAQAQIPTRLSDSAFWKLVTDFSETNGFFRSDNFVSNEVTFQWVIPELANTTKSAYFEYSSIAALSAMTKSERFLDLLKKIEKETDPKRREALQKELRDMSDSERGGGSSGFDDDRPSRRSADDMRWQDLATLMPYSDQLIGVLSYRSKGFSDYVLSLLSGLLEVARLVLIVLLIGSMARAAKDHDAADRSMVTTFMAGGATIVAMIVVLLVMVILDSNKPTSVKSLEEAQKAAKSMMTWAILGELLVYAVHIGSLVMPAILALQAKNAAARRAR